MVGFTNPQDSTLRLPLVAAALVTRARFSLEFQVIPLTVQLVPRMFTPTHRYTLLPVIVWLQLYDVLVVCALLAESAS